jgi:hypothetical protein
MDDGWGLRVPLGLHLGDLSAESAGLYFGPGRGPQGLARTTLPTPRRTQATPTLAGCLDGRFRRVRRGHSGIADSVAPSRRGTENWLAVRQAASAVLREHRALVALAVTVVTLLVLAVVILPPLFAGGEDTKNDVRSTLLQGLAGLFLAGGLYFTAQTLRLNRESAERTYRLQSKGRSPSGSRVRLSNSATRRWTSGWVASTPSRGSQGTLRNTTGRSWRC